MLSTYHLQFMLLTGMLWGPPVRCSCLGTRISWLKLSHRERGHYRKPEAFSPLRLSVRKDSTFSSMCTKTVSRTNAWCGRQLSPTGILDLVGTCAFYVPQLGLFPLAASAELFLLQTAAMDDCCGHCQEQRENKTAK